MSEVKVFDVGRLRNREAGRIVIDGVQHVVLQVKGKMIQGLRAAKASDAAPRLFESVAECVPSLTPEQIGELNIDQAHAILGIAGAGVEAIEELYPPNVDSPATPTSPG